MNQLHITLSIYKRVNAIYYAFRRLNETCQEHQHEFDNKNKEESSPEQPSIWTEINFDRN